MTTEKLKVTDHISSGLIAGTQSGEQANWQFLRSQRCSWMRSGNRTRSPGRLHRQA